MKIKKNEPGILKLSSVRWAEVLPLILIIVSFVIAALWNFSEGDMPIGWRLLVIGSVAAAGYAALIMRRVNIVFESETNTVSLSARPLISLKIFGHKDLALVSGAKVITPTGEESKSARVVLYFVGDDNPKPLTDYYFKATKAELACEAIVQWLANDKLSQTNETI